MTRRPARPRWAQELRGARGVLLGLLVVLAVTVTDWVVGGRTVPLTGVLLGPLLASAVAPPAGVAVVAALASSAAIGLTLHEDLHGVEAWTRVALVATAGLASCLVAFLRTHHEQALEQADRVAGLSHALQQGLLPPLEDTDAIEVRARYRPTSRDLVVGGDFMDVVAARYAGRGAVAFCVGDVTGHDAAAASLGASLRAGWRVLALSGGDPASWLESLDAMVHSHDDGEGDRLATVCVGLLEPEQRRLTLASAGHPRPVLVGDRAAALHVDAGPPLGVPAGLGLGWTNEAVGLDRVFSLVVYTDGLVEGRRAPGSSSRYGEESLAAWLDDESRDGRIEDVALDRLLSDVLAANGGPLGDDVALVVLASRRVGEPVTVAPAIAQVG